MQLKRLIVLAALAVAAIPAARAQSVSFNATITGEVVPGVYGQVVLGDRPPPPVVYARPVIAEPLAVAQPIEPIYLHVPPGHAKHWRKHCHEYHACNRPVYFVKSAEYEPGFNMERWRAEHEHGHHGEHEHGDRGEHGHGDRDDHEREHRDN